MRILLTTAWGFWFLLGLSRLFAGDPLERGPAKVLIVVAHPDDEVAMAATTYRLTHDLGGIVDQLVITNGEGGFNYALLAEKVYGVPLTQEAHGRRHLPSIRKSELLRSGKIWSTL